MGSFSPRPGLAGALRGPRAHSTHTPHPHTPRGSRMPTPEPCTPRSAPTVVLGRGGNGEGPTGDRVTTLPFWGRGAGSVVPPPSSSGAEPFPGEEAASPSCAQFNRVNFVVCCSYPLPGQATTANAPPNPSTCSPGPRGGGGGLGHLPGGHRAGGTILATPGWGSHPRGAALGLVPRLGGLRWLLLWHYSHGLCPWHCVCPPPSRSQPDPVATESGCVSSYVSPPCHVQQLWGGGFPLHRAETWQLAALMALPSPAAGAVGPDPAPQLVGRGGAVLGKAPSTPPSPTPKPSSCWKAVKKPNVTCNF